LIAGKIGKKYAIEVKSTKKSSKYISKEQIESFMIFCEIFDLKPVIAIRFNRLGWFFLEPKDLEDSGKNLVVSLETARTKGKRFSQFFGEDVKNKNNHSDLDLLEENEIIEDDEEIE
jgi:Holliday junction resolvase